MKVIQAIKKEIINKANDLLDARRGLQSQKTTSSQELALKEFFSKNPFAGFTPQLADLVKILTGYRPPCPSTQPVLYGIYTRLQGGTKYTWIVVYSYNGSLMGFSDVAHARWAFDYALDRDATEEEAEALLGRLNKSDDTAFGNWIINQLGHQFLLSF